ncbi:ABC transporter permease subunit [Streptomyces sp. NBC_00243]|uniref:ABC transporter permease n=1 Tax=Streptomyces sp. NBC_00243 TaxID=2975688 RepID=UPI002DDC5717|nr:ABC transporter permease [Streptomyces sp. NBC_00243]WRZ17331.1 ABC transporter permease subunit [Streptomyces sp. NBC_00243]
MQTEVAAPEASQASHRPVSGFVDILRSEFLKLGSVRTTLWTLWSAVVFNIGLGALVGIFVPGRLSDEDKMTVDAIRLSLAGLHLSQIAMGALGVLVITSEYSTGMIRATFSAIPQRRTVLAAKVIVFAVVAFAVGIVSCFGAFYAFEAFLSEGSMRSSLGDPGVLRAVLGGGLYLGVLGLFGLGLGIVIRATAGAIAALFGMLFVPPILLGLLPNSWQETVVPYTPLDAGSQIFITMSHNQSSLGPWSGMGVFSLYAFVAVFIGFLLIYRRDA